VVDDEAIERIEAISANGTIGALLADLTPDVRAAVEGRIVDEREYTDLAERLECSESVVRKPGQPRAGPAEAANRGGNTR
jgi:RNA polymerase sigma-70 factor (ECF subfamily)